MQLYESAPVDDEQRNHDLALYGAAYQYRIGTQKYWLKPENLTVYRKENETETPQENSSLLKRFILYITQPALFVFGVIVTLILFLIFSINTAVLSGACWYLGNAIYFMVFRELRDWARPANIK